MSQLDWVSNTTPLQAARKTGERLGKRAESKAEAKDPDFPRKARELVIECLKAGPTSSEAITNFIKARGVRPHDDRAFGPTYQALSREGLIVCVGSCLRVKGNGTAGGRIWSLA